MGGRGQGKDRRSALPGVRCRRPLSGRQQRRPHGALWLEPLRAALHPVGYLAPADAVCAGQRHGLQPAGLLRGARRPDRCRHRRGGPAVRLRPGSSAAAGPYRARRCPRACARHGQDRYHGAWHRPGLRDQGVSLRRAGRRGRRRGERRPLRAPDPSAGCRARDARSAAAGCRQGPRRVRRVG